MVQTNFTAGDSLSLAAVLLDISGGTDAAINTAYTITLTQALSAAAESVSLGNGSSVTLAGSAPFIVNGFSVTGTLITGLNFTGTVTLDNGVFNNVTLTSNGTGTIIAGLYTGAVLGTLGDSGDIAINSGDITNTATDFAAVEFSMGTVQNGWNGPATAQISGAAGGVFLETSGMVQNGGTIGSTGTPTAAVFMAAGTVDNGQIGDIGASISGQANGVEITGTGVIANDGTIVGGVSDAIYLGSGTVTNGQIGDSTALISGGTADNGLWINTGFGTVTNFGTISGGGASGVLLKAGGTVTNGVSSDPTAQIVGAFEGVLLGSAGSILNDATIAAVGNDATQSVIGVFLENGGSIGNLNAASLIEGLEWGAIVEGAAGTVTNVGLIQATAASGLGVDLSVGGSVVNGLTTGSAATISGAFDGVRISAGGPGAGAVVVNNGTIDGTVGVDFGSGPTPAAGTLTNNGLIESSTGTSGIAVEFGAGSETLVLQSDGAFLGQVLGAASGATTMELAAGTQGTLSALGNDSGTVTDGAGSFAFSSISTIAIDAGASWMVAAPGTLDTVVNAGALNVPGGSVTISGSLSNSGGITIAAGTLIAAIGGIADVGVITVGAGAVLKALGGGIAAAGIPDLVVGGGASSTLNVSGAGATVNSTYQIGIGSTGEGSGLIDQGGTVLTKTPFAGDDAILDGGSAGASGALTISDPGSLLRATGQLSVGLAGDGSLLIENQATAITGNNLADASEGVDIGQLAGGSGQVTVSGAHSLLTNTGRFVIGDFGLGHLMVDDGGTISTTPGTVAGLAGLVIGNSASASGSEADVSGAGSDLAVTGLLNVGVNGSGAVQISGGATVTAGSLDSGNIASAVGQISVSGAGSSLNVNGPATIADDGTGVLSVLSGATFAATNLTIGAQTDSSGAVVVSGTGSQINLTGALNIGTALGTGDLTLGPGAAIHAGVINQFGQVVDEGGLLDPTVLLDEGTDGGVGTIASDFIIDEGTIAANSKKAANGIELVSGTVVGGGTLTISGGTTLDGTTENSPGLLLLDNIGTLEIGGPVLNAADTTFSDNGTPTGSVTVFGTYEVMNSVVDVQFLKTNEVLILDDISGFAGTVTTTFAGDKIVITGGTLSNLSVSNGTTLTMDDSGQGVGGTDRIMFAGAVDVTKFSIVNNNTLQVVACFAAGTRIETANGLVAVEELRVGDQVVTADVQGEAGSTPAVDNSCREPIVWIGQRTVSCARHPNPETVWPIRVSAGAFGKNVPVRDLYLSPDHAIFVNDVLVPVKLLVNGTGIVQMKQERVRYFHVELPRHAVIKAEGLLVESYLDLDDRANFSGDRTTIRLIPDFAARLAPDTASVWEMRGAAPLVVTGPRLDAVRKLLSRQAGRRSRTRVPVGTSG